MKWYSNNKCDGVIISTRVRLARNISGYSFAPRLSQVSRVKMINDVRKVFEKYGNEIYSYIDMSSKNNIDKTMFVEEHIISRDFALASDSEKRLLVFDENGSVSVMVGEEDHLRIQAVRAGFNIDEAFDAAIKVENMLSKGLDYAFDEKLGYLTCCPSNTGTGLRISCMLHLPMLSRNGYINSIIEYCTRLGLTVRGFYGEGSEADGDIYQISNQVTLGISEVDTIKRISDAVTVISNKEKEFRNKLNKAGLAAQDKLWRSYGILQNSRCISSSEMIKLWSDLMLAKDCNIISDLENINLVQMLVESMPAHIISHCEKAKSSENRDIVRAERIRKILAKSKNERR